MLKEFKNFIMTGNVIDFAVAVIMAGAMGLVINGFVADIIMPIVGEFAGGVDFVNLKYVLTEASGVEGEAGYVAENAVRWGAGVKTIVNLFIVGYVMFIVVKAYKKTKTPPAPAAPSGPSQEELLTQIRDLLKK